jgi:DNA ligase (NAD+)
VQHRLVKDIPDIYELSQQDLMTVNGFGLKSAQNLYDAIQSAKQAPLDRFLYALGIRHVGQHAARILASHFGLLKGLQNATLTDLEDIDEIGPEIAQSVRKFFEEKENRQVLKRLQNKGIEVKPLRQQKKGSSLRDKIFVFTGSLKNYTRREAQAQVEHRGGRAMSSVSDNTDYVVVGKNPGRKLEGAHQHNLKTLHESEFEALLAKNT